MAISMIDARRCEGMGKTIDMGEFTDDELLDEMKLRGYFVEEINKLQQGPVPSLWMLREWNLNLMPSCNDKKKEE